jgi:hypothetical protein
MDSEEKLVFDQIKDAGNMGTYGARRGDNAQDVLTVDGRDRNLDQGPHEQDWTPEDDDYQGAQDARREKGSQDGQVGQGASLSSLARSCFAANSAHPVLR